MTAKTPDPSESRPASAAESTPSVPEQPAKASAIPPEKPTSAEAAPAGAAESAERAEPTEPTTAPTVPSKPTSTTATSTTVASTSAAMPPAAKVPAAKVAAQVPARVPARPATPPPAVRPRRSNGSGGAATVVAVLSLLLSIGGAAVAVYALDVAREAKSLANIAMGADQATGQSPATPTALPVSTPSPTATPGPLFVAEIQQVQVQIPAAVGCASVYFDVDALRIGVEAGHELYLSSCVGPLAFRVDRVSGVATAPSVVSAQDCADRIARNPSLSETVLPVQTGMVMCLLTSGQAAQQQGIPQKVGIIEVRGVNSDRSVTVAVSTYRVPT